MFDLALCRGSRAARYGSGPKSSHTSDTQVALGLAPQALSDLFPLGHGRFLRSLRTSQRRRAVQLHDPIDGSNSPAMSRSAFGEVYTYTSLPDAVAELPTIKQFQRQLQRGIAKACRSGTDAWRSVLSTGVRTMSSQAFHALFL